MIKRNKKHSRNSRITKSIEPNWKVNQYKYEVQSKSICIQQNRFIFSESIQLEWDDLRWVFEFISCTLQWWMQLFNVQQQPKNGESSWLSWFRWMKMLTKSTQSELCRIIAAKTFVFIKRIHFDWSIDQSMGDKRVFVCHCLFWRNFSKGTQKKIELDSSLWKDHKLLFRIRFCIQRVYPLIVIMQPESLFLSLGGLFLWQRLFF